MKPIAWTVVLSLLAVAPLGAQTPSKTPVLLDTDIGTDIDDAFALGLILASPELELVGITTVGADTNVRAMLLCRFLTMTGRRHKTVAAGAGEQPDRPIKEQYQYYYHPDVLFNRTRKPETQNAVDFLHARLKAQPGQVTLLACGPLTNIGRLLTDKPEAKPWIKRIILTASPTNLRADPKATEAVLTAGVPLTIVPPSASDDLKLNEKDLKKVFAPATALSLQMQALYQLWDKGDVPLADVLAVALAIQEDLADYEQKPREAKTRVVTRVRDTFPGWYVGRMADCVAPADRPSKLVAQGGFPHRVHVSEDFDTDIERRWWMSGKAELKDLPPGSSRACRGVLTHDFDDLLGHPRAMHTAVVFNPVPGPPMGKNTRLSFRYRLDGTDTMRVQIYSLSNGYHRHLVLTGLPQGRWEEATVDMTTARRPDGTGGPLSEGERIDDIQFYVSPKADVRIDDIVLHDAAPADEKRPFPKRVHFTGVFDSGKQGKEWPGDFEIVTDAGAFWKAARSVANPETGSPWLRIHLRGERPMAAKTRLTFRYRLRGGDSIQVLLPNRTTKQTHSVDLKGLKRDSWTQATVDFSADDKGPKKGDHVDEVRFLLSQGSELLVDDLILYEP